MGDVIPSEIKNYRLNIAKNINYELNSAEFSSHSKDGQDRVFVRERKLTVKNLIVLIMSLNRSVQRGLDEFFTKLNSSDYTIREAGKSAFSQARAKLSEQGFVRLNTVAVNTFYDQCEYYAWYCHRVLAVDGTRLLLPNHTTVKEEFGTCMMGRGNGRERSMASASLLYDVLNQITLDAQLAPYKNTQGKSGSERAMLEQHMEHTEKGDLLLMDRGYPSIALFFLLIAQGVEFCARMKGSWWKEVRKFRESENKEAIVSFSLPEKDKKKLKDFPEWVNKKIRCRLVKVVLDTGEIEILCTSLTDTEKYPLSEFKALYHLRWTEEEAYKLLKNRLELEAFTGKTARAVRQDFFAKVFMMTLAAAYAHPIEEKVRSEYQQNEERKHSQKINRTQSLSAVRDILIGTMLKQQYDKALEAFDKLVYCTRELVRPNRKNDRIHRPKKPYSMNYKRL